MIFLPSPDPDIHADLALGIIAFVAVGFILALDAVVNSAASPLWLCAGPLVVPVLWGMALLVSERMESA